MSSLLNYVCPSCDGKIEFNAGTQNMKCPYCDTEYDVSALEELEEAKQEEKVREDVFDWENTSDGNWDENDKSNLVTYLCNTCSGELITDKAIEVFRSYGIKNISVIKN